MDNKGDATCHLYESFWEFLGKGGAQLGWMGGILMSALPSTIRDLNIAHSSTTDPHNCMYSLVTHRFYEVVDEAHHRHQTAVQEGSHRHVPSHYPHLVACHIGLCGQKLKCAVRAPFPLSSRSDHTALAVNLNSQ
eukprot:3740428-Amphidinium_carterae.1